VLWHGVLGDAVGEDSERDFFISYTAVNEPWAKWIAVTLDSAGYTTLLQAWDFWPGSDFVRQMQDATSSATRTIAVLSDAYLGSRFGQAEWRAVFARDPTGERGLLVPVRVQPCELLGLLASRVYIDLVDVDEAIARERLLEGVATAGAHPTSAGFPGGPRSSAEAAKRFPGAGPEVSNLPARNPRFIGRGEDLARLHADLLAGSAAGVVPVQAVHGLGGIGKTTLALEYAYRFASDYDLIWWVPAEQPTTAVAALARLASRVGVREFRDQPEMASALFDLLRGRSRWLLIYDNAERPDRLEGLFPPDGGGHVLVTSRWSAWGRDASPQWLQVLPRKESVEFLRLRTGAVDLTALDELAELVSDLPLALEEAAAYLEETQDDLEDYVQLVRERARELFGLTLLDEEELGDRRRVATVWSVSLDRIHADAPAAEALLNLCAFLAPDVPRALPREHPEVLPDGLATVVSDRLSYNRTLAGIGRYSLASVTSARIELHRLVQTVIQVRLGGAGERVWVDAAVRLLREAFPSDSREVGSWPRCERLLPHLLTVTGHATRLGIAGEPAGWLLERASAYLRGRGQQRQAKPIAERALAATEAALGPHDVQVAWRRDELGRVLRALGDIDGARLEYERGLQMAEAALGPDHPCLIVWLHDLGGVLRALRDLAGALARFQRALEIGEAALDPDNPDAEVRRIEVASALRSMGPLSGARPQYVRALQIGQEPLGPGPSTGIQRIDLASALQDQGELSVVGTAIRRLLELGEAVLGPDDPLVARWRDDLGVVLQASGDLAEARMQIERALLIGGAVLGPDDPEVARWRNDLGSVLLAVGDLAGARLQIERGLEASKAALGPDHPDVAVGRNNLGRVLQAAGDLPGARVQFERALQITETALGPDHPDVAVWRNNVGSVLQAAGDLPGARVQFERALQITEAALGADHPEVAVGRNNLGKVLQAMGDLTRARTQVERALQIAEAALGPDNPTVGVVRNNLGDLLQGLGDLAGARALFDRALQIAEAAFGPQDPRLSVHICRLGQAFAKSGDLPAAVAALTRAVDIDTAAHGPDHPKVAADLEALAAVREQQAASAAAAIARRTRNQE
jgi:tetratricopeptide (TPR) repeat protein